MNYINYFNGTISEYAIINNVVFKLKRIIIKINL